MLLFNWPVPFFVFPPFQGAVNYGALLGQFSENLFVKSARCHHAQPIKYLCLYILLQAQRQEKRHDQELS